MPRRSRSVTLVGLGLAAVVACILLADVDPGTPPETEPESSDRRSPTPEDPLDVVQLAFAGDVHFAGDLSDVPSRPASTLGPMSDVLRGADLAMVNLESAVTSSRDRAPKEFEAADRRYWFRTGAKALEVLVRSGVDIVSVANNHGADFGVAGIRDTIRAGEASDVAVIGVGRNEREAFAPHRVRVRGTDIAVHAADASRRESKHATWAVTPGSGPGIAAARGTRTSMLASAVRDSARIDDLVVVYLNWGREGSAVPTASQERTAQVLHRAGADIVVGTHAHTLLGAGLHGSTYVSYGLGNFHWYHGRESEAGVLLLSVSGAEVVGDTWVPGRIPTAGGGPRPLRGAAATAAVRHWNDLRASTNLAPGPGPVELPTPRPDDDEGLPAFASTVAPIRASVRRAMRTYDARRCPVPLDELRHVTVTHVGFDGRAHRGELVVHADVAADVVDVFAALYAERFPIKRMLLVDEYDGNDDRSMADNNSSAFNCRPVAGTSRWSDHAYGRAIDINPVQNPYVVGGDVRPPAAERNQSADRGEGANPPPGVIHDGDVVRREFARIGWEWGGHYADPDYQHFSQPNP